MKIVIDTNVLVSSFLSPNSNPARIIRLWEKEAFEVIVSTEILEEYRRVLNYNKIQKVHKLKPFEVEQIISTLRIYSKNTEPTNRPEIIKEDPDDNKFIWAAMEEGAEYIISGDEHLLKLGEYKGTYITTPAAFLSLFK